MTMSEIDKKKKAVINRKIFKGYVMYGLGTGMLFPLLLAAYCIITGNGYGEIHRTNAVYYLIDLMPVIMSGVFYVVGYRVEMQKLRIRNKLLKQIEVVEQTSKFARSIGQGEFNVNLNIKEDDVLGKALLDMRDNLRRQSNEEEERNWIMEGVAKIGEILSSHSHVQELGDAVLAELVPKVNAVQGAFYIAKEDEENKAEDKRTGTITMLSCFAYNRKKYDFSEFRYGQGLVGQAAMEMAPIYRKEVPDDFVTITSGLLGDKKPSSILVIPLITDSTLYGVLEFASLKDFNELHRKFLEQLSELIARTMFNISANEKTLQLLGEVNKSQQRTQVLLKNASEVINIYDGEGKITYASPSVSSILGYNPDELLGSEDADRVDSDSKKEWKKLIDNLVENPDQTYSLQYLYTKKDGEEIWLESTGRNLIDNPSIGGLLFNTVDITERRKAEREQRERAKMQALSENSPDIIMRFDLHGTISYVNPTIEKYTGIDADDFLYTSIDDLEDLDEKIRDKWENLVDEVKVSGEFISDEMEFPDHEGNLRFMGVNVIPEMSEKGMLESVLMVLHDITESKIAEMKIQEANIKITDSINYAQRIQGSILPKQVVLADVFPESMMYFIPKDVVSGDFPFFYKNCNYIYAAAVDCTGHGVPGALLSVIGSLLLSKILDHSDSPTAAELCDQLHESVVKTLRQGQEGGENERDGMDIAMCKIHMENGELEFAGAHRPLYILRNDHNPEEDLEQFKGDKYPIGGVQYKGREAFNNYTTKLNKGDRIFFFSDGYPDQFGGENGEKKIGPKRIRKFLVENKAKTMQELHSEVDKYFQGWKGDYRQMDDVLFIGIEY